MSGHILEGHYLPVLSEIARWKIIDVKSLFKILGADIRYDSFCQKIKRLEDKGILQSIYGAKRRKFISLSQFGAVATRCEYNDYSESMNLNHDIICSTVLRSLQSHSTIIEATTYTGSNDPTLDPDGVISVLKNDRRLKVGIEVELTRKSRNRVTSKFTKYSRAKGLNNVLYIINSRNDFEAYKSMLLEMSREVQEAIILMCYENLSKEEFNFLQAKCFYQNTEKSFTEIFG